MDTKQIMYFMEVAEKGSYSTAAKSLSVSQPTLSIAVQKLEEELKFHLFTYEQRKVHLTNNGHVFYKYAQDYINAYNRIVDASSNIRQGVIGSVTIIAAPLMSKFYLGDLLSQYHEFYPEVELNVCSRNTLYDSIEMLNRNEADFCLHSLPLTDTIQTDYIPVIKQKMVLGVHESHPLAKRRKVAFPELANEVFLDTTYDYNLHRQFMQNCEKAHFTPKIAMRSNDMDFLASLVERNWGVFMMPRPLWKVFNYPNVRLLDITDADVDWDLGLIYRKDVPMSNACQSFLTLSSSFFKKNKEKG